MPRDLSGQLPWTPSLVPEPPALCSHTLRREAVWMVGVDDIPRGLAEGGRRETQGRPWMRGCPSLELLSGMVWGVDRARA